jgi:hypothetical protein
MVYVIFALNFFVTEKEIQQLPGDYPFRLLRLGRRFKVVFGMQVLSF